MALQTSQNDGLTGLDISPLMGWTNLAVPFLGRRDPGGISDQVKEFTELVGFCCEGREGQPHDPVHLFGDRLLPKWAFHSRY